MRKKGKKDKNYHAVGTGETKAEKIAMWMLGCEWAAISNDRRQALIDAEYYALAADGLLESRQVVAAILVGAIQS